jgi:hypothetical protein
VKPLIWMFGGVHDDPRSGLRFVEKLATHDTAPHFAAVEGEQSAFQRLAASCPWVAEGLNSRWGFPTWEDRHELSPALAWERHAYAERFPGTDLLWQENGFQEADLKRRYGMHADKFPESCASTCSDAFEILVTLRCTILSPTSPPARTEG